MSSDGPAIDTRLLVRRVVTGVDQAGKSCVASDEELGGTGVALNVWTADGSELPAWVRAIGKTDIAANQPPAGGSRFMLVSLPPWDAFSAALREHPIPGMDEKGFHTTRTIDYLYVLDGPLILDLETGSVDLGPGDFVVQLATRHAWRNPGTAPVRFLAVLTTLPEPR
jgi:mannose-6-phosphate isomerase-like protein (cupin superfamily)